jgi:hypothetical protein
MDILTQQSLADPKQIIQEIDNKISIYYTKVETDGVDTALGLLAKLGINLHPTVIDKIRAYWALGNSELPYKHWHVFEKVASAVLDGVFSPEVIEPPSEIELAFTAWIIYRDFKNKLKLLSDEVKTYVTVTWHKHYGYAAPHSVLIPFWNGPTNQVDAILNALEVKEKTFSDIVVPSLSKNLIEAQANRLNIISSFLKDYGYSAEYNQQIRREFRIKG